MQGWKVARGPRKSSAYHTKGWSSSEAPDTGGSPGCPWAPGKNGVISAQ